MTVQLDKQYNNDNIVQSVAYMLIGLDAPKYGSSFQYLTSVGSLKLLHIFFYSINTLIWHAKHKHAI